VSDLARQTKIPRGTLWSILNGHTEPMLKHLEILESKGFLSINPMP
jgi:predicted transcriptional regulator